MAVDPELIGEEATRVDESDLVLCTSLESDRIVVLLACATGVVRWRAVENSFAIQDVRFWDWRLRGKDLGRIKFEGIGVIPVAHYPRAKIFIVVSTRRSFDMYGSCDFELKDQKEQAAIPFAPFVSISVSISLITVAIITL
jgi:hypothetical protein